MASPTGFRYVHRKSGEIVIFHHGKQAAVLRGQAAKRFAGKVVSGNEQELMARASGNYRRGNERR